uniref:BTB domain-containing protein n=1 Tax=Meloidogyne incognita TaxID=6306 RepID=A0A914LIM6_MELIC
MGEVFELPTNSSDPPLELIIDQKIFAIKLEMRYINEVRIIARCLCSRDGDLEVFATKYDPEPFAWIHRALLAHYTPKLPSKIRLSTKSSPHSCAKTPDTKPTRRKFCLMMEHCSIIELF